MIELRWSRVGTLLPRLSQVALMNVAKSRPRIIATRNTFLGELEYAATLRRQTNSLSCTRRQQQPGVFMAGPGSDSGRLVSVRWACPSHPSSARLLLKILSYCNPRSRNPQPPMHTQTPSPVSFPSLSDIVFG
ncbi:hypothetical protein E2C01_035279 [Portunus trituberculatus]|uniref:Uncharacterized protein n=1 Tax=Portunus trituberculatus TaxID=210409 RepID=A0A5B7F8X7_PORTR|nr:hypothetical protein [Portunus trituberculatus]